jgi:hypothetical protein
MSSRNSFRAPHGKTFYMFVESFGLFYDRQLSCRGYCFHACLCFPPRTVAWARSICTGENFLGIPEVEARSMVFDFSRVDYTESVDLWTDE